MTKYSEVVRGDTGNYHWPVAFDLTDGEYLGITQYEHPRTKEIKSRVLLTWEQVEALRAFVKQ